MRQDAVFADGQGVSARHFARLVAAAFDGVVTVDPHLHRIRDLADVFPIPCRVARAAPALARWVAAHVEDPVLVGPDEESEQWVADVAARAACPSVILRKVRRGDRDVDVSAADLDPRDGRTPVVVDDIVSTGHTIAQAVRGLVQAGHPAPVCLAVHGVLADDALAVLRTAGTSRVVTTNTIPHPASAIDVMPAVAEAVADLLAAAPAPA
jgi:ribose-phosphate pyrophosphokinase